MPERRKVVNKKIGELLLERGVIDQKQLEEALKFQSEHTEQKKLLGEILVELGFTTEEEVMICLTTQYGLPYLPLENYEIDPNIISSVTPDIAKKYNFIPIDKMGNLLTVVACDVIDEERLNEIEQSLDCKVQSFITTPTSLKKAILHYYG